MRRLGNLLLVAVLFLVLLCHGAAACIPAEEAIKQGADRFSEVIILDGGKEAEQAGEIFNAIPPESNVPWNFVVLASLKEGGWILMVGKYQAVCEGIRLPPDRWNALLRSVRGVGT